MGLFKIKHEEKKDTNSIKEAVKGNNSNNVNSQSNIQQSNTSFQPNPFNNFNPQQANNSLPQNNNQINSFNNPFNPQYQGANPSNLTNNNTNSSFSQQNNLNPNFNQFKNDLNQPIQDSKLNQNFNTQNNSFNNPFSQTNNTNLPNSQTINNNNLESIQNQFSNQDKNLTREEVEEIIEEIIEKVVDEKMNTTIKNVKRVISWKEKVENDIAVLKEDIINLKDSFDRLEKRILGKINDYDKNILNVNSEIKALEKVFQKITPTLVNNVNELSRIVRDIKIKSSNEHLNNNLGNEDEKS